jgi:hypothetical protein
VSRHCLFGKGIHLVLPIEYRGISDELLLLLPHHFILLVALWYLPVGVMLKMVLNALVRYTTIVKITSLHFY